MPALVEEMFYVGRQKPWHGLGVQLEDAPTSKDAIIYAGLDWTVSSEDIYDANHNIIPGYRANVRSSDSSVLGIVSGKYSIVQNEEAFAFTDSLVDEGMVYETAGSLRNGKQIWLLGRMPETYILDDKLEPYICFTNTHDGTGAVRCCCTPVRVVCNNTLNLALSTAKRSWSTRHIGDIESKLQEAKQTLNLASAYTVALQEEAERLAAVRITDETVEGMLETLYPVTDADSDVRKKRLQLLKDNFFVCMDAPDIKKYRGTAYGAVMAITDYVDHAQPMRATSNYNENRWGQIIVGHPFVDMMYKQIQKVA